MKNNKDILTGVLKTAQMGQTGIRCLHKVPMGSGLRRELQSQLQEYDAIEQQAENLAASRGWRLQPLDPALRFMAGKMSRLKLMGNTRETRIADMMIQGNTQGMIKSLRDLHAYQGEDTQVVELSRRLLRTEICNIRDMQPYL